MNLREPQESTAGFVASITDAMRLPVHLPPTWPVIHTTRLGELLRLKVGEAMKVNGGANALIERASVTGRGFVVHRNRRGRWIIERVK